MRIEGQRESANVEDRRGMGPGRIGGRGRLGIGTIILALAVSYFTGADPMTVLNLLTGVQSMTEVSVPSEPGPVGPPRDQLGKFASVATRLRLFDQATARQRAGEKLVRAAPARSRGWTREELYQRGRPR